MTKNSLTAYLDELSTALELRDAPEDLVTDVVRQVESHILETGEDPYEAFGKPSVYASKFTPTARLTGFWMLMAFTLVLTLGGGWLLVNGVINAVADRTILWGLNPWYGVIVGGLAILAWALTLIVIGSSRRRAQPRSGRDSSR